MRMRYAALAAALALQPAPAFANSDGGAPRPRPRAIAAIAVGERAVELLAVTQRARADTPARKDYLEECQAMGKVLPGYPQPAFVSVDLRVRF